MVLILWEVSDFTGSWNLVDALVSLEILGPWLIFDFVKFFGVDFEG